MFDWKNPLHSLFNSSSPTAPQPGEPENYEAALQELRAAKETIAEQAGKISRLEETIVMKDQQYAELEIDSSLDGLTAVLRPEAFLKIGAEKFKEAQNSHRKNEKENLAVCVIDVTNLKYLNDNFGHIAGNELIQIVPVAVQNVFRHSDIVGRIGGDEFAVIIPQSDAANVAERLDALKGNLTFKLKDERIVVAEFAYGLCVYNGHESFQQMVEQGDAAMYQQKAERRSNGDITRVLGHGERLPEKPSDWIGLAATPSSSLQP